MSEIRNLINEAPEVGAAIITAVFGILGIVVNIIINYTFRKKDYKLKNFAHNLEIVENFYIPFQRLLDKFTIIILDFENSDNLYDIIKKKGDAKNDSKRQLLQKLVSEIDDFLSKNKYNYIGSYELYKYQQDILKIIYIIKDPIITEDKILKELTKEKISKKINVFNRKIEDRKTRLLSNNYLLYLCRKFCERSKDKHNL